MRGEDRPVPTASARDGGNRAALLTAELAALVGREHARAAGPGDAVDGVAPACVIEAANIDAVASVVRHCHRAGLAVIARGGGTKLDWGHPPGRADVVLSTGHLDRVLEHAWSDMTATVEAGCTVAHVQETLAEHGQRIACDPLWTERATIGGVLATNDNGPLRARFGALRDLIIGVTLVLPDGTVAKSGGKVVKNVAGYDLPKLATGSFGTLAVIVQAVFRLHPLPRETRTLSFAAKEDHPLCELALAIQASQLAFVSLQLRAAGLGDDAGSRGLDVKFEGTRAGLDAQEAELQQLAAKLTRIEPPPAVWRTRETLWQGREPAVAGTFSVLPTQLASLSRALRDVSATDRLDWRMVAQGLGVGQFRLEGTASDALIAALLRLRATVEAWGGTLVVLRAPLDVKARLDVWGSPGDALPLLRRVKQQLDPSGMLAPGRFVGGI